ncbi:oligosaccharide repeat unit polymerase [Vibrio vulnificus]|uniref:O-antigen polymerase n=1 Tax=Vibrio vulnificus TaxID=672 RepID=UPI0013EED795|nr:O-antigen polymerase [Vibrio vulnificus]MCA4001957.1 oligosaccharide repeat unit polymerase [Vibrio vulnificus]MCA4010856.1 oligosaccharide repeat unit polymerase [Vibrio vulnificus]MDK2606641.1 O-antigen polymerase [Vibrio vulnificus]MDK2612745.1 O-antigen polymerase [Vibrio vulnificus]MDK2629610.1 O-antigen polymerase [Vibrio vulnificus]
MTIYFYLFLFLIVFSFYRNIDVFSPSKVYLVIFATFFGEVFWKVQVDLVINLIIFSLLIFSLLIILLESHVPIINNGRGFSFDSRKIKKIVFKLWVCSAVPIIAQLYLLSKFGGLELFVSSIGGRVVEWQGLGPIISLIKLLNILNYIYFIIIVKSSPSRLNKVLFLSHFVIFIFVALLSGSRSNLLWNFVFMLVFYHYSVKNTNVVKASILFLLVLTLAMIIGVARSGYSIEDGKLKSGVDLQEKVLNMSNFKYGLQPLHKILEFDEISNPQLGLTYLTAITNLVPRSIWPGKPDTGGVIITRDYFDDPFGGFSNYTTGLFPEAIINFGFVVGFIFAIVLISFMHILLLLSQRAMKKRDGYDLLVMQGVYPFLLFGIPSYIYAEFTTNTISMLLFKVGMFLLIFKFVTNKIKFN